MSINIGLVSDKPEFTNFFSENVTLPINSEAVLVKANMDLPLLVLTSVTVPVIDAASRGDTACVVDIDGIAKNITWTDIYAAHTSLAGDDIDAGVTADEYFSGSYEYIPNNQIHQLDAAQIVSKLNFAIVLGAAIDTAYEFYRIEVQLDKVATDLNNIGTGSYTSRNITAAQADESYIEFTETRGYKLVATYTPQKLIDNTLTEATIAGPANFNFVLSGAGAFPAKTLTSTAALCQAWSSNENIQDLNGGWWQTTYTHPAAGTAVYGVSLEGVGHGADEYHPQITAFEPEVFDVGFQFEIDGAEKVFKIIDGNKQHVYYDTGANAEVTKTLPLYHPPNAKLKFHDNDRFFIQIQRGNLYNGTNEFVIRLYHGRGTQDLNNANTRLIYVARRTLNSSAITPNIGFMSNGTAGHIFADNAFVPLTVDTIAQSNFRSAGVPSAQALGQFSIVPQVREDTGSITNRNFWSAFGIYTDDDDLGSNFNQAISTNSENQTVSLSLKTNFKDSNSLKRYFLGQTELSNIFRQNAGNTTVVNTLSAQSLRNLPKELKVAINNLPIKSFQGQYINTTVNRPIAGGENRVIGTIPVPEVSDTDVNIPIVYEPFNLLYRPLNNVEPFNFNQVFCEIFFQDFDTNRRRKFGSVNGHLTLDINVRQGARPPKPQNNLVPI